MAIAEAYQKYVDEDFRVDDSVLDTWAEAGIQEFVEGRVAGLVRRWQIMNVYLAADMPRQETAKLCRQAARDTCSWLMRVNGMEAYDWTYLNRSTLMPIKGSPEWRELAHIAASLDIADWMGRWREDALARITWFASVSSVWSVERSHTLRRPVTKLINKTIHAVDRELGRVVYAIGQDQAKPKRREKAEKEEE